MSSAEKPPGPVACPPPSGDQFQVVPLRLRSATAAHGLEGAAVTVVHFPLFGVVQDVEGRLHLLKLLFGGFIVGIHIGVVFSRQVPIGLLNLRLRGVLWHP